MSEGIIKFRQYVEALPGDIRELLALAGDAKLPKPARRWAVAALNYVLLNLDLVPDWVPVIGLCDDTAVMRVAMGILADQDVPGMPVERVATVGRLANEADAVRDFLGPELAETFRRYVESLADREIQGRRPDQILRDDKSFGLWKRDVEAMLKAHRPDLRPMQDPDKISRDLLSYFRAKLGRTA